MPGGLPADLVALRQEAQYLDMVPSWYSVLILRRTEARSQEDVIDGMPGLSQLFELNGVFDVKERLATYIIIPRISNTKNLSSNLLYPSEV